MRNISVLFSALNRFRFADPNVPQIVRSLILGLCTNGKTATEFIEDALFLFYSSTYFLFLFFSLQLPSCSFVSPYMLIRVHLLRPPGTCPEAKAKTHICTCFKTYFSMNLQKWLWNTHFSSVFYQICERFRWYFSFFLRAPVHFYYFRIVCMKTGFSFAIICRAVSYISCIFIKRLGLMAFMQIFECLNTFLAKQNPLLKWCGEASLN